MGYVINMPKLEMGMNQGTLLEWHVDIGDSVEEDDVLAEIESEKTIAEIPVREGGVLRRVFVEAGETVDPGTALGIVAGAEEDITELERGVGGEPDPTPGSDAAAGSRSENEDAAVTSTEGTPDKRATPRARRLAAERDLDVENVGGSGPGGAVVAADVLAASTGRAPSEPTPDRGDHSVRATPRARRLAAEEGVKLTVVEGSGPKGAVTATDIEAWGGREHDDGAIGSTAGSGASISEEAASEGLSPTDRQQLSGTRRTIAERLGRSYREAVHVTVSRVVDAEELLRATEVADDYLDSDVSVTDLLLLAISTTLREHPAFNARLENDEIAYYDQQNIGLAVDAERGLMTPVLRDVASKTLGDIATERRTLTAQTLSGESTMSDMSGGTFTVSNLGVFGVDSFDPIINPPQVAILGITRLRDWPVRDGDGGVTMRRHIGFDLSFDHRAVDGADAARTLDTLASHVRDPWPVLLERTRPSL